MGKVNARNRQLLMCRPISALGSPLDKLVNRTVQSELLTGQHDSRSMGSMTEN
jgi:hypothetical protein